MARRRVPARALVRVSQVVGLSISRLLEEPEHDERPRPEYMARLTRMEKQMDELTEKWRKHGYQLGFGVGIAQGYATLGMIGFEGRVDYGAIGPVTNLASRLCDEAQGGQILISQRVYAAVEELVEAEPAGELPLKGFHNPVPTFNVVGLRKHEG